MKQFAIYIAAIAVVVLSSCSREALLPEQDGSRLPGELASLTISTGEMTKTSLSGTVVNWSDDDQIAVFDDLHYNNKFDAVEVDGSSAVFEGLVTARTTDFYAVYPYSDAVKADAESIYVSLPADQTPVSGTFAEEHNISVANATKAAEADAVEGVVFKNVCALIQFTVPQRLAAVSEVTFTANNRTLAGDLVVSKDDMGVTCNSGTNTVKMTGDFAAGSTFYFVVAPGEINGFSATVKTKNGATFRKSSTKTFTAKAGAIKNLGEIDFTEAPTATAKHKYENGVLTGTTVTFNLGLPDGMEAYVTKLNARMTGSDGRIYGTIGKPSASKSVVVQPYTDMPYLPQGEYTIQYLYVLNGVEKQGSMQFVVDEKPEFTVSASAYTSYSKYRSYCETNGVDVNLLNEANACDGSTMYDIKCSVSISDAVIRQCALSSCSAQISNENGLYSQVSSNDGTASTISPNFYSLSKFPNLPWGKYSLRAEVTFDGVTRSASKTFHVTGLPYKMSENPRDSRWVFSGGTAKFESDTRIILTQSKNNSASLAFSIPENTNVKLYSDRVTIYTPSSTFGIPTVKIYIANALVTEMVGANGTAKTKDFDNIVVDGILTSSNQNVKFERIYKYTTDGSAYINNVSVYYR